MLYTKRKRLDVYCRYFDYKADFTQPKVVGYFSVDKNGDMHEDISSMRYTLNKPQRMNFDDSPEPRVTYSKETKEEPFFTFLTNHKELLRRCESTNIESMGFVFSRTTLIILGIIPYAGNKTYRFCAHLLRGVIYVYHEEDHLINKLSTYTSERRFCQNMSFKYNDPYPKTTSDKNVKETFVTVLEKELNGHHILYRSELLGITIEKLESKNKIPLDLDRESVIEELNNRELVELTQVKSNVDRGNDINENKARRQWIKSFWGKSNKTLCGFINNDEIIIDLRFYTPDDLEIIGEDKWKGRVMVNFIDEFLRFIKESFAQLIGFGNVDIENSNLRIYFQKNKHGSIERIDNMQRNFAYEWVPEWYIENRSNN